MQSFLFEFYLLCTSDTEERALLLLNPISSHVFKTSVTHSKHLQRRTRFPSYLSSWRMECLESGGWNTKQLCLRLNLYRTASKVSGLDVFWDRSWRKGSCGQPQCARALGTGLWMPEEGICSSQVMGSCISHDHSFLTCRHKWLNQISFVENNPLLAQEFKQWKIWKSHENLLQC